MSCGSTDLTDVNVILPLDNVLTYEMRKALGKPEPTHLKFRVSRFFQSYSLCASQPHV